MKVSFFDIGTNSIHMKIVDIHADASFEVLEHEKNMTRIGQGSFKSMKLSKRSMRRGLKIIQRFSNIADEEGVKSAVAVATSAVRDSKNGHQFVKQVRKKTGIRVRVISGKEEGRLIFLGAVSGVEKRRGKILTLDIGGGSVECVLGDYKKIYYTESLPMGVARLSNRFISKNPPSGDNLESLENHIEDMAAPAANAAVRKKFTQVIGTGGTMINLAAMVYQRREGRPLRLRGFFELKKKELAKLHQKLVNLPIKRIAKVPGLDKKRADTITAGSLLVLTVMRLLKIDSIFVSDKGIREGMILDTLSKKILKNKNQPPTLRVQWFGQKPFFSGRVV